MSWYNPLSWDIAGKIDSTMAPKNNFRASAPNVDSNAYKLTNQYGGDVGQGIQAAARGGAYNVTPSRAANATAASLQGPDLSQSNRWAADQRQFSQALQQRALGGGSSAAQEQLKAGLSRALAGQQASAASARGISAGMAQRLAALTGEQAMADANAQAAQLRAQEQVAAEQGYSGFLQGARGQDLSSAGLSQQAAIERANFLQQASLANAGFQQQTNLANQEMTLQAQQARDQAIQAYVQLGMSHEQAAQQALADEQAQNTQRLIGVQQINAGVASGNQQTAVQGRSALVGAAGGVLSGLAFSDIRVKTNIRKGDEVEGDVREFLDALKAYAFDYKSREHGGKNNYGFMAQDAEKSKLGKTIVVDVEGTKAIDGKRALMAALAGLAHLNGRLKAVEGKAA